MITPQDFKSSALVGGFPSELRVARVPLAHGDVLDRRERELAAGRIAAQAALAALVGPAWADATIERDDDGAPRIARLANPPLLSISHTRDHAVAVVGHARCLGIDLCAHADAMRVRRVVVRFVAPDETALVERGGVSQWTALWALKEAAAKAVRRGLLDGGLRASQLSSIEPPRFAWPALDAIVVYGAADTLAVVYKR